MSTLTAKNSCNLVKPSQVRKIGPTRRSLSGRFSFRGESSIPFESSLERDYLMRCEFSLSVLEVIPQPVQIRFTVPSGRQYQYTPDFLVYYRLGNLDPSQYPKPKLIEVKPKDVWKKSWRASLPKWKAARRLATQRGWEFKIMDESRIRDSALTNIRFLQRYKNYVASPEEQTNVLETVRAMGSTNIDFVLAKHFGGVYKTEGLQTIYSMLATRLLDCDIRKPLNELTEMWVPNHE